VQEKLLTPGKGQADDMEWCIMQQTYQFYIAKHAMPTLKEATVSIME
jgi:hypothetical protein